MTSTNLSTVKLEGTPIRIRRALKFLNGRATLVVHGSKQILFIGVPHSELGWLDKVAKDIGCKKLELNVMPKYETALCGLLTTDKWHHEGRCKACGKIREARGPVKKPRKAPTALKCKTVGKVEPGQSFDLNGVIASVEVTHDRIFAELEGLENLLTNLKGYRDAMGKLSDLEQEAKDRMNAARNLLQDGKF